MAFTSSCRSKSETTSKGVACLAMARERRRGGAPSLKEPRPSASRHVRDPFRHCLLGQPAAAPALVVAASLAPSVVYSLVPLGMGAAPRPIHPPPILAAPRAMFERPAGLGQAASWAPSELASSSFSLHAAGLPAAAAGPASMPRWRLRRPGCIRCCVSRLHRAYVAMCRPCAGPSCCCRLLCSARALRRGAESGGGGLSC